MIKGRCRGKFVARGKFFPPPYCHNVTNANPNPNLNPSANPNPNLNPSPIPNPKFNLILTLTRTAACGNNFSVRRIFHYTAGVTPVPSSSHVPKLTLLKCFSGLY